MHRLLIAIVLAGCGGGGAPPNIDADPRGPVCAKKLYDLCVEEHDCDTSLCQPFGAFSACTTSCSASTPCPKDKSGSPAACDNGACHPSAPNMCHLPGS